MQPLLDRLTRPFVAAISMALLASTLIVAPGAAASGVSVSTILTGYSRPVLVTAPRGSNRHIYIVEQTGRIKVATWTGSRWRKVGTFLDVRDRVKYNGAEQGLLGLAFAPDYGTSGKFYIDYTRKSDGATVVAQSGRLTHDRYKACKSCLRSVITISQPYPNHNGGMLAFGPDDLLYIGMGDGGSGGDPHGNAQKLSSRLGKILRIKPKNGGGYSVPSSNPFVGTSGAKPEIWLRGVRNPWRFSFDRSTGDLVIGDVGQEHWEEVDFLPADGSGRNAGRKANLGWDVCEGRHDYPSSTQPCAPSSLDDSVIREYSHSGGRCSVTGGYVYRGPDYPAWRGIYTYADYCSGQLWAVTTGGKLVDSLDTNRLISGFGEDGSGRLYATDLNGRILKVKFSGKP